jgi:hypothetical protein
MPAIFDFLYREFCRARLVEMRKQLFLVQTNSPDVAEANCSVSPSDGTDGRTGGDKHHNNGDLSVPKTLNPAIVVMKSAQNGA